MSKKIILPIGAIALASILLISGFGLSQVHAQTNSQIALKAKIPTGIENRYSVIFQVCAGESTMRAPEVVMSSDSAVKNVKLNKVIAPNSCKTTATQIDALDPKTIKIKKVDKQQINKMITKAQTKLAKVKSEISSTNAELDAILETIPGNIPTKPENIKKVNDISSKLSELRKELKDARGEYYRLLYILRG